MIAIGQRVAHDAKVVFPERNAADDLRRDRFGETQFAGDCAGLGSKADESGGKIGGGRGGNGKFLVRRTTVFIEILNGVDLCEQTLCMADKNLALRSQGHAVGGALKNHDAEIGFQLFNGAAEIGLRDEQSLRGFADRAGFCYFYGIGHMKNVHLRTSLLQDRTIAALGVCSNRYAAPSFPAERERSGNTPTPQTYGSYYLKST